MSSMSNVGNPNMYGDGDQRNYSKEEEKEGKAAARFEEGKPNSHQINDPKDSRSLANRAAQEMKQEGQEEDSLETQQLKQDPTLPARAHGNKPSRGAEIDKEIADEEAEILKKKGAYNPQ